MMHLRRTKITFALLMALVLMAGFAVPQAVSASDSTWRGEYYANQYLAGAPTLIRQDPSINFAWGNGSPDPRLPSDNFSVRWTRNLTLSNGWYRFHTRTDDGVRLFVDGQLIINQWHAMPATEYIADILLQGKSAYAVRMEYYEQTGVASAALWWEQIGGPSPVDTAWRGEYFANPSLSGPPVFTRYDPTIDFDWGYGSPGPGIPADWFSVRWTRTLYFDPGHYTFSAQADDGVRVWVDGQLIINDWRLSGGDVRQSSIDLAAGTHAVQVEYFEATGRAMMRLWWGIQQPTPQPIGNIITCVRPTDSWIRIYRRDPSGAWVDMNPHGWGPISSSGYLKIDGLPVDPAYGGNGQPYRVELWAGGILIRSVGNTDVGQPEFRVLPWRDNYTPWGCPAP